ncbi:MAG: hypothetical protein IRZ11_08770, partial [Clostridia bacterium]|nr:hypothetical protein [Clostridia bacterium]
TAVKDTHPELDVRLVVFPGENHEVTMAPGPIEARLRHYEENLRWFARHLGARPKDPGATSSGAGLSP